MKLNYSITLGVALIFVLSLLSAESVWAEIPEGVARERAIATVRAQMGVSESELFLGARREEEIEDRLLQIAGPKAYFWIFRIGRTGVEVKGEVVVSHISVHPLKGFMVAISRNDGSTYRIRGFDDSLNQFQALIKSAKLRVQTRETAKNIALLYLAVAPKESSVIVLSSLLALKQEVELRCHAALTAKPLLEREQAFEIWWKASRLAFEGLEFDFTVKVGGNEQVVGWLGLSMERRETCGGEVFRAHLRVGPEGIVDEPGLTPLATGR